MLSLCSRLLLTNAFVIDTPTNITTTPSLEDLSLNSTFLGAIDKAKFQIAANYGQLALPATSVLMTAMDVMVQLALMEWNGRIRSRTFRIDIPRYSNVEIFISPWDPAPDATLKTGLAVYGLFQVMDHMLSDPTHRFKSVQSILFYDNHEVGWLMIRRTAPRVALSAQEIANETTTIGLTYERATQSLDKLEAPISNLGTTMLGAPAWVDSRLKILYSRGTDVFTINEMFFAAMVVIVKIAVNDRTARVRDFTAIIDTPPITKAAQPMAISIQNKDNPPRTTVKPPLFQWEWLVKAIGRIPQYMLDSGNFRDVTGMLFQVDGETVGGGLVERRSKVSEVGEPNAGAVSTA